MGAARRTDRVRAVVLAGHLGDDTTAREGLADPDPRVRAAALGALHRLGALDAHDLDRAAADPDGAVRARAAELSGGAGGPADRLVPLLADPDPSVVEAAAWGAGECQPPPAGAVAALGTVARSHPDPLCREAAVAALGAIGDPEGLGAVLAALEDRVTVRRRAVLALAPFHGPAVDAALARHREDRDWQVRQAAEDLS